MSQRIPDPLIIPANQWTAGEAIDELKLSRRIDDPLETMGAVARTWNTDAASIFAYLSVGVVVAANTRVLWTQGIDANDDDYDPATGAFTAPVHGLYLVAAQLAGGSTPFSIGVYRNLLPDPNLPQSGNGPAGANTGAWVSGVTYCNRGDAIQIRPTAGFTVTANGLNYFLVHQMTWT